MARSEATEPKKSKSKGGRPSKLDDEAQAKVIKAIKQGAYRWAAARMAGVSTKTFYNWLEKGAQSPTGRCQYAKFLQAVEAAEAEVQQRGVLFIQTAGRKDWRAMAWYLEHRFPADFSMKLHLMVQEKLGDELAVVIEEVKRVCGPKAAEVFEGLARRAGG